jgi:hypothetical protein
LAFNVQEDTKENVMKHPIFSTLRLIAAVAIAMTAPFAMAHSGDPDVSWSISVGSPRPALRVYAPPPVVYVQPQPVYVRPQPVYVQPAAVVQYGQPYYVEDYRHKKHNRHHWKHDRDWRHDH